MLIYHHLFLECIMLIELLFVAQLSQAQIENQCNYLEMITIKIQTIRQETHDDWNSALEQYKHIFIKNKERDKFINHAKKIYTYIPEDRDPVELGDKIFNSCVNDLLSKNIKQKNEDIEYNI